MTASWTRRSFDSVGLTQHPPGAHLAGVQDHFVGKALLCLDVSWSMDGAPLAAAKRGAVTFLGEAREAGYRVGAVLWAAGVVDSVAVDDRPGRAEAMVAGARPANGTDLAATLRLVIRSLGRRPGDRAVCVFGDGDVGDRATCSALATEARSLGIRFVVRGLGRDATARLSSVLTPGRKQSDQVVSDVVGLEGGIAGMSASLRKHPSGGDWEGDGPP